jgi:hypothetical protein
MARQGTKDGSKEGRDVEADEVDDTDVKHLSLDFETGQRALSQIHLLCQVRMPCTGGGHRVRPARVGGKNVRGPNDCARRW